MNPKAIPWWAWLIPIVLLLIAAAPMPYGYYTFLRIVVCISGAVFAYIAWSYGRIGQTLAVAMALFAILFNPVFPVHLKRAEWLYLNILGAALFAVGLAFLWLSGRSKPPAKD
jgi:hypothetical protein